MKFDIFVVYNMYMNNIIFTNIAYIMYIMYSLYPCVCNTMYYALKCNMIVGFLTEYDLLRKNSYTRVSFKMESLQSSL